ncbi:hypothetical protein [Speluncibacter jeojiensis]|uniref:Uncharacterized protein n=1 Tax=Speluncibacter jeojiensis TaxID=2710754 RepID=A0A9X4M1Y3_9ACTN|nr:hypothetical protein [Corynebacteriales bacterium D3-21]
MSLSGLVIIGFVVASVFGLVSAIVASERGLSAMWYGYFGFFCGPIGLFAAVVAPYGVLPSPPRGWSREQCVRCGERQNAELDEAATYTCWRCGQHVKSSRMAVRTASVS